MSPGKNPGKQTNAVRPKMICGMHEEEKIEERGEEHKGQQAEGEEGEEVEIETEEEDDEDQEHGQRHVRKLHDLQLPSEKEVQEHYLSGHMPYRSWCHHCVRGRGREMDHLKRKGEEEKGLPEYHLD